MAMLVAKPESFADCGVSMNYVSSHNLLISCLLLLSWAEAFVPDYSFPRTFRGL